MARAASTAADATYDELDLSGAVLTADGRAVVFDTGRHRFTCNVETYRCTAEPAPRSSRAQRAAARNAIPSPDGTRAAFIRDHNLWVRDLETGEETPLTTDGEPDFGYATNNAGWTRSDRPVLLWSPDSRRIATFQHDGRGVGEMYPGHHQRRPPRARSLEIPAPRRQPHLPHAPRGDRRRRPPHGPPPDAPRRAPIDRHRPRRRPRRRLARTSNGPPRRPPSWPSSPARATTRKPGLRIADPETGAVRDVLDEARGDLLRVGLPRGQLARAARDERGDLVLQRDDWGHLYLYDLETGRLKHPITRGDWNVLQLLRVDAENRQLYFTGAGARAGRSVLPVPLPGGPRRLEPDGAHARQRQPRGLVRPVGRLLHRHLLDTRRPAGLGRARHRRPGGAGARAGRRLRAARSRVATAGALHGQGPRRRDRPLRPALQADALRPLEDLPG